VPLTLTPQPEGGYLVRSPLLPELITEGDTLEEALDNARDAFDAVLDIYESRGWALPDEVRQEISDQDTIHTEQFYATA
jgi:antitoxin HicB